MRVVCRTQALDLMSALACHLADQETGLADAEKKNFHGYQV
jgi:hypothetical protein